MEDLCLYKVSYGDLKMFNFPLRDSKILWKRTFAVPWNRTSRRQSFA